MPYTSLRDEAVAFHLAGAVLRTFASAPTMAANARDIRYLSRVPTDYYPEH
jgi:hypothetical protein